MGNRHYMFTYYKKYGFKNSFNETHYCDENMLLNIIGLEKNYLKSKRQDFYTPMKNSLDFDLTPLKRGNFKLITLAQTFKDDVLGPYTYKMIKVTKLLRGLDKNTMCFKDYYVDYVFENIKARCVFAYSGDFFRKFTVFEEIGSLKVYVNDKLVMLKSGDCPFIKDVENKDGSLTLYPYAGYCDLSIFDDKLTINIKEVSPNLDRLEDLLVDLHLESLNSFYSE